jgi:hypothetical protein
MVHLDQWTWFHIGIYLATRKECWQSFSYITKNVGMPFNDYCKLSVKSMKSTFQILSVPFAHSQPRQAMHLSTNPVACGGAGCHSSDKSPQRRQWILAV